MTGAAPDLLRPVVGFRAWRADRDGTLHPFSVAAGGPWVPGVNDARCHLAAWAGGAPTSHEPPDPGCMCGLYALADPHDARLAIDDPALVVGAIAAWGDLEVHRTGFRARHAGIVALASTVRRNPEGDRRRAAAATRYGVDVVARPLLAATALRFGDPVPAALLPGAPPARGAGAPPAPAPPGADPGIGLHLDEHTWVRPGGPDDAVTVGITWAFAAQLAPGPVDLTPPAAGGPVRAGDALARLRVPGAGPRTAWAPLSGLVGAVNPRLADDPGLVLREPEGAGWLVRLHPSAWAAEAGELAWGPRAAGRYAAHVRAQEAFAALGEQRLAAGGPSGWGDVLAELRRRRTAPPFRDAAGVERELAAPLRRALAADPLAGRRLARLDLDVALELTDPVARIVLACRPPVAWIPPEGDPRPAGLTLGMSGAVAQRFLQGRVDVSRALRCQDIVTSAPMQKTFATASVLSVLPRLPREPGVRERFRT